MKRNAPDITRTVGIAVALAAVATPAMAAPPADYSAVVGSVQTKVVKIYGSGGLRGMEAYQSGILISPAGHVLTVSSYVLDEDPVIVVLDDGRRFEANLIGADPLTEIAILKCPVDGQAIPYFDLYGDSAAAELGVGVLAVSNLFGIATGSERASVVHGVVTTVAPLAARRGAFSTRYRDNVYIVDAATNNPGAAGGALTDWQGRLLGMLGKEVRSELTGTWLNYSLPVADLAPVVEDILSGRYTPPPLDELNRPDVPLSLAELGIVLVPNIVLRTPPYVDHVVPESPAATAGLRPDDLIIMVNQQIVNSCSDVEEACARLESGTNVTLAVLRDDALSEFELSSEIVGN